MEIRRARPADAAAIAEVHVRTWQAAYDRIFDAQRLATIDVDARARLWDGWLTAGEIAFVAEDDGSVVAFAWVGAAREVPGAGELYAIYVIPEAWGSRAGTELMREACAALRDAGFAEAILWVLDDNPRARRFYEREGWHDDGGRKHDQFLGHEVEEVRYRIEL